MPLLTAKEEKAIYDAWWAVKYTQGRWVTFIRSRLGNGEPLFTTYGENAKVIALSLGYSPEPVELGEYRLRVAGWQVYHGVLIKLNDAGYRAALIDAPLPLVLPPRAVAPARKRKV